MILTRSDHISFYRWLRRKRIEKLAEQQAVRERTRQLRLEAKHSKQLQNHLYMSEAKAFRFTDHYNWEYLLNISFGSCYSQNFRYHFLWPVLWSYSKLWKSFLSFGNTDSEFLFFFLNTKQNKFFLSQCCIMLYHLVVHATNWTINEL